MEVKWLIENYEGSRIAPLLVETLIREGIEFKTITGKFDEPLDFWSDDTCVVFHGSLNVCQRLQREKPTWIPGAFYDSRSFQCTSYYHHFSSFLLNQEYIMLPAGDLIHKWGKLAVMLYEPWSISPNGISNQLFIRPNTGFKTFSGHVTDLSTDKGKQDWGFLINNYISPDDLILVARVQLVHDEYRIVLCDGLVVSGSQYMNQGEIVYNKKTPIDVDIFAQKCAAQAQGWETDHVYVMDICNTTYCRDKWELIEVNSFSGSDPYDCDLEPIVHRVNEIAVKCWYDIYGLQEEKDAIHQERR